jgi:hypothetical protein
VSRGKPEELEMIQAVNIRGIAQPVAPANRIAVIAKHKRMNGGLDLPVPLLLPPLTRPSAANRLLDGLLV